MPLLQVYSYYAWGGPLLIVMAANLLDRNCSVLSLTVLIVLPAQTGPGRHARQPPPVPTPLRDTGVSGQCSTSQPY